MTGKEEEHELVTFKIDDPENPKNWSKAFKWYCTAVVAATCFVVAVASSIITADLEGPAESFNVSHEVTLISVTVFVVGFGKFYPFLAGGNQVSLCLAHDSLKFVY